MLLTTSSQLEGYQITEYLDVVFGEAIVGANIFRDLLASVRDIVGGRSGAYEAELRKAREIALGELEQAAAAMGADAVIAIDVDYETVGQGSMLMVTASGTAVRTSRRY
ncbi:MAG: heavy metal-binding domain-containing protein [Meiothermus sp.]|uniref:heavy metal-binding domain-containing protein n=1 Tax=Meiothermus sp. TaxID=1955249 RepID=UPI0028CEB2F8|nr:heavy metal-binding domain-containing protein [Meiothermus sp.]MDT7919982.1 heavy metal-binding domain-containing protein [Meiothermus sp.]